MHADLERLKLEAFDLSYDKKVARDGESGVGANINERPIEVARGFQDITNRNRGDNSRGIAEGIK